MAERRGKRLSAIADAVGGFAARHAAWVLVAIFAVTAVLAVFAVRVEQDDDVVRFLPQDDPEVERFQEIGDRFGGLSIAIVGIEATGEGDIFELERLRLVREIDEALSALDGVNATTSFTELPDVVETETDDGRTRADLYDLVGPLPSRDDGEAEVERFVEDVRSRTLARDHIRGALVSEAGDATIILCQIAPDAPMKQTADAIRAEADARVAAMGDADHGVSVYYGGAPFIGSYAAENTRRDLLRLSPWVCLAVVLIMLITSRSLSSVVIALVSVAIGIVWVLGGLELAGRSLTLVSSSLPVLLVALGSAYSVHLLAAVLAEIDSDAHEERIDAVTAALRESGPPIIAAGATTAAGFASFLIMDIGPMREFGVLMSSATLVIVFLTLVIVPAACVTLPMRPRPEGRAPSWALRAMAGTARAIARRRRVAFAMLLALGGISLYYASQVEAHSDIRTLFTEDSEPVQAEQFLDEHFGGSLYLQIELTADIKSPLALRQLERLESVTAIPDAVSSVQSIATAVVIASYATTGEPRIPPARKTTAALGELVESDPAARLLVTPNWDHTLLQVQLAGFDMSQAREVAARVDELARPLVGPRVAVPRSELTTRARARERREITDHLRAILRAEGVEQVDDDALAGALGAEAVGSIRDEVRDALSYNLVDDPMVMLADPSGSLDAIVDEVMTRLTDGALDEDSFYELLLPHVTDEERARAESLRSGTNFVFGELRDIGQERIRALRTDAVAAIYEESKGEPAPERVRQAIERALWPLGDDVAMIAAEAAKGMKVVEKETLGLEVSGYPIIHAEMNDSVQSNQWGSLAVSAVLVIAVLAFFFRSLTTALIAAVPAAFTLLIVFGLMGLFRIPMDVGTSMISAIALGVGIDYAVHLLWRHGRPDPDDADAVLEDALGATGWGIVINALEVSVGLSLLAFGTIVPMRNFGLLTASAMLVSALCTLMLVPVLARRGGGPAAETAPVPAEVAA